MARVSIPLRLRLRLRRVPLAPLLLLLAILPVVILTGVGMGTVDAAVDAATRDQVTAAARIQVSQTAAALHSRGQELAQTARRDGVIAVVATPSDGQAQLAARTALTATVSSGFVSLAVVDASGSVIAASAGTPSFGSSVASEPWFPVAMRDALTATTADDVVPDVATLGGAPVEIVVAPVRTPGYAGQAPTAMVAGAIRIGLFSGLRAGGLAPTLTIADPRGVVITSDDPALAAGSPLPAQSALAAAIRSGSEGSSEGDRISAEVRLAAEGWWVEASVPAALALVPATSLHPVLLLVAGGLALVLVVAALLLARAMRRRRLMEDELLAAAQKLIAVIHHASSAMLLLDSHGVIEQANPAARQLLGDGEGDVVGSRILDVVIESDVEALEQALAAAASAGTERRSCELLVRRGGGTFAAEVTLSPIDAAGSVLCTLRDVTEEKRRRRGLEQAALTDSLTGLANRRSFDARLEQAVQLASRRREPCALFVIDLDGFKQVNDRLGHAAGDALLVGVARRLRRALRQSDTVARLGGDEFAVIAADVESQGALVLGRKILAAMEEPMDLTGESVTTLLSIGIAVFPADGGEAPALFEAADRAMYLAKRRGAGQVCLAGDDTAVAS